MSVDKTIKLLKKAMKEIEKKAGIEWAFNKINTEYYHFSSGVTLDIGIQIRIKQQIPKLKKLKK